MEKTVRSEILRFRAIASKKIEEKDISKTMRRYARKTLELCDVIESFQGNASEDAIEAAILLGRNFELLRHRKNLESYLRRSEKIKNAHSARRHPDAVYDRARQLNDEFLGTVSNKSERARLIADKLQQQNVMGKDDEPVGWKTIRNWLLNW